MADTSAAVTNAVVKTNEGDRIERILREELSKANMGVCDADREAARRIARDFFMAGAAWSENWHLRLDQLPLSEDVREAASEYAIGKGDHYHFRRFVEEPF